MRTPFKGAAKNTLFNRLCWTGGGARAEVHSPELERKKRTKK